MLLVAIGGLVFFSSVMIRQALTFALSLCLMLGGTTVRAQQTQTADSVSTQFRARQLVVPASLITVGAVGVSLRPMVKARKWVNKEIGLHTTKADDYLRFLPAAAYLGLGKVGVNAKHDFSDRLIAGTTAYLAMGVMTQGTKWIVSEQRPDSDKRNSFPSGHAAVAFTGAELMRIEYGNWIGLGGYVVATGVGIMRLCNQRHWANDLLAGAGIGILSAHIGYWLLPLNRKWIRPNYNGRAVALLPTYSPLYRNYGLSASIVF